VLADALARALFVSVTAAVDITDAEVQRLSRAQPAALRQHRSRSPSICAQRRVAADSGGWLDARCAELVELAPGYEASRRPASARQHPQALMDVTLALDIGGTKIAAGLVDADGTLVHHAKLPTPDGDAEAVWAVVDTLITEALAEGGGRVRSVGVASAGPIDLPAGTVSPINITAWRDFPVVERVSTLTGAPVRLGGDGLCMALGEQWRGAARGARFLLGMVVSTGVGGGARPRRRALRRAYRQCRACRPRRRRPGRKPCSCGGRGCVETIAAGPRMAQWARDNGWEAAADADARGVGRCGQRGEHGWRCKHSVVALRRWRR